jgi:hypothetical protein
VELTRPIACGRSNAVSTLFSSGISFFCPAIVDDLRYGVSGGEGLS